MTDVQLIECLRMLPSLVELVLDYDGPTPFLNTNTPLQQLIHHPPKLRSLPLLNPRLQVVALKGYSVVDARILGHMAASRWRIHRSMGDDGLAFKIARLKSVRCECLDNETKDRLDKETRDSCG